MPLLSKVKLSLLLTLVAYLPSLPASKPLCRSLITLILGFRYSFFISLNILSLMFNL